MDTNRKLIDRVAANLVAKRIWREGAIPVATQGYLRFHADINTSLSSINFNVLENQGTTFVGEERLSVNDMFTVTHWALYVGRCASTAAGAVPTAANQANMKLYTNNNPLVFTTTGDNLRTLYNGQLNITLDRNKVIDGYDLQRFWRVGSAQEGLQQTVTATVGLYQADTWQGPNYGFAELDPEITFNGGGQNDVQIQLPNAASFLPTGNFWNAAVLVCRGIRWQNGSKLNA